MTTRGEILAFSCDQLHTWLLSNLKDEVGNESIEEFRCQRINGKAFLELTDDELIGEQAKDHTAIHQLFQAKGRLTLVLS